MTDTPIRLVHVLYHFGIGGLENGLVNLINALDEHRYEHTIVCMTDHDDSYLRRLRTSNFAVRDLHKRPGQDLAVWPRMWRELRAIRPHILHTRNLTSIEMQLVGRAAAVPGRIHGEHGWDMQDLHGQVRKYRLLRRAVGLAIHRFIALSRDLEHYLIERVGIPAHKVTQIYNGVDVQRFQIRQKPSDAPIVIGTVGRLQAVKNQTLLCRAFAALAEQRADLAPRLRLRLVGGGPLETECRRIIADAGLLDQLDMIGPCDDVASELGTMDIFVLPSLSEGVSNTILEAMAAGLPVIATAVGGNPELVEAGGSGVLIGSQDEAALSRALADYAEDPALRQRHGRRGRALAETRFSLTTMVESYDAIYRALAA